MRQNRRSWAKGFPDGRRTRQWRAQRMPAWPGSAPGTTRRSPVSWNRCTASCTPTATACSAHDADDALQDALLRAWRDADRAQPRRTGRGRLHPHGPRSRLPARQSRIRPPRPRFWWWACPLPSARLRMAALPGWQLSASQLVRGLEAPFSGPEDRAPGVRLFNGVQPAKEERRQRTTADPVSTPPRARARDSSAPDQERPPRSATAPGAAGLPS